MAKFFRYLLGIFLIAMGANKFLNFFRFPEMSPEASQFMSALMETGYMLPMIGLLELTTGLMLFAPATTPLALLLLAPLSVNIILFHLFLDPSTIGSAAFVAIVNLSLGIYYIDFYKSIFAKMFNKRVYFTEKENQKPDRPLRDISKTS